MKKEKRFKTLINLFLTFFKLGIFAVGGGPTMLTLLHGELVEKKKWLTNDELMEMTAIAESTPGPIAVNLATYLGYKKGKFLGALVSTLGVIITPFILMFVISLFLQNLLANKVIGYAFVGIKCGVAFLLLKVSFKLIKGIKRDAIGSLLLLFITILSTIFTIFSINFSSIYFILFGAFIGLIFYGLLPIKKGKE